MKKRIVGIGKGLMMLLVGIAQVLAVLFLVVVYSPFLACFIIIFPIGVICIFAETGRISIKEAWETTLCWGRSE